MCRVRKAEEAGRAGLLDSAQSVGTWALFHSPWCNTGQEEEVQCGWKFVVVFFNLKKFFSFIYISWRLITLQYCSSFCHTLIWISHGFTYVPHPDPPPTSLPIPSLWIIPVHRPRALVSCIQPGLVVCFTLDSTLVSMLFSQNIKPSPSPIESNSLFYTSLSLFLSCI